MAIGQPLVRKLSLVADPLYLVGFEVNYFATLISEIGLLLLPCLILTQIML